MPQNDDQLDRRGFIGKVVWASSGAVLAATAALSTSSGASDTSGPTGPRILPATGSSIAGTAAVAGVVIAAGAAVSSMTRRQKPADPENSG